MPRFVLLEHDHPHLHWDLMLEADGVLLTWRLAAPPAPGRPLEAERVFDHRLMYLDYEGPISGGRGQVVRRQSGTFDWLFRETNRVRVRLTGENLRGVLELEQLAAPAWQGEFTAEPENG
jgi:hypothetical protein